MNKSFVYLKVAPYTEDDRNEFFKAAEDGDYKSLERLLDQHPDLIDSKDSNGNKGHFRY